ncbi:MAG: indolepyruvate oxidoreductase subunit beta [Candidatus Thorarchaeota archaeon]|jgi:indolepyruvate ferredoxin oxidoreductase beta subunit
MSSNIGNTVNIAITGVGGQGVLTLAEILAKAALQCGLNVRVGEIHGMAQRGGHVVCTVRIGENAKGPIVDSGSAHLLVGFEPIETLREIQLIRQGGCVLMSSHVQYPVAVSMGKAEYPNHDEIIKSMKKYTDKIVEFDALELAAKAGSTRALNMVMLGAIIGTGLVPITEKVAINVVRETFPKKFEKINTTATKLGLEQAKSCS